MSVKIACEEEHIRKFVSGAYVAKTWKEEKRRKVGVEKDKREGGEEGEGVIEVGDAFTCMTFSVTFF